MKPSMPPSFSLLLVSLSATQFASAALLVNETYDNYTPIDFLTTGPTPNAPSANGLGLTGTYVVNNPGGGSGFSFAAGGLAFADYNTTAGNKLIYKSSGGGTTLAAELSISSSVTGTLYSSYLVNINVANSNTGGFTEVRVAPAVNTGGDGTRFRSQPDSMVSNANGPGIGYSGTTGLGSSSTALTPGATFMVISRFTNVGTALSAGTPGTGTIFVLNESQYLAFKAASFSESYLNTGDVTARVDSTAITSGGPLAFASGNFIQIGGIGSTNAITYIDALKYGTDLTSVVTIPEPSAAALVVLASIAGFTRRRRG